MNSRELILEATFVLGLKEGFNNISTKEIQEATGLSTGALYYHFKNKDDIIEEIVKVYFLGNVYSYIETIGNSNDSFIEKMENVFNYLSDFNKKKLKYHISNPDVRFDDKSIFLLFSSTFYQFPHTHYIFDELNTALYNFYHKLAKEAIENKEIRSDIDLKTLATFMNTVFRGYIYLIVSSPVFSAEDLINSNLKIFKELTVD